MNALEKIKSLRNQKGLSQKRIADILGISQTGYAKIEKGKPENISLSVAVGIAKALDVGFNDLFDIVGDSQIYEQLRTENERLKGEVENQKLLITFLKEKHMITSPQTFDKGELFDIIDSLDVLVEDSMEEDKQIIEEIENNPTLKAYLEDGTITNGRHYHVWKEYFGKK
jgi:transcriptional regulator with XRE-family HTH domain